MVLSEYDGIDSQSSLVSTSTNRIACCFISRSDVIFARLRWYSRSVKYLLSSRGCLGSNFGADRSPLDGMGIGSAIVGFCIMGGGVGVLVGVVVVGVEGVPLMEDKL
jgi:hypothetical protein